VQHRRTDGIGAREARSWARRLTSEPYSIGLIQQKAKSAPSKNYISHGEIRGIFPRWPQQNSSMMDLITCLFPAFYVIPLGEPNRQPILADTFSRPFANLKCNSVTLSNAY
jgi:hypothetical protein